MKLVAIPFSGGGLGHGNGANLAPETIQKQLTECFANERGFTPHFIHETIDVDESNIGESHNAIEQYMHTLNTKAILVGGDHSITCPCVTGLVRSGYFSSSPWFVVFDAHPDLMDDFRPPTQEDYLRVLVESEIVQPERIILLGVRNWDVQEITYLKEKGIRCFTASEIFEKGVQAIMHEVVSLIDGDIYLSIDIDVVDPVEAIGTGYIEYGGLSSRELLYAVEQLRKTNQIKMIDLVEVNPTKDIQDMTSKLAAKIIFELSDF